MRPIYDVSAEIRGGARRVIGSPRPTSIRSGRPGPRGGAQKKIEAPHWTDPEERPEEFIIGAPKLAVAHQVHNPVEIKKREHHAKAPCFSYSAEVIQTVNVIRAQGGELAVREYLKTLKEKTIMSHSTDVMEMGIRKAETPPVQEVTGTMEAALSDAENKTRFYESEMRRCTAEAERWRQVAAGLKQVMQLTAQPLSRVMAMRPPTNGNGNGNGNSHANGNGTYKSNDTWSPIIKEVLTAPMTSKELTDALQMKSGKARPVVQMSISARKRAGKIIEIDGKLYLPEWTDPPAPAAAS